MNHSTYLVINYYMYAGAEAKKLKYSSIIYLYSYLCLIGCSVMLCVPI